MNARSATILTLLCVPPLLLFSVTSLPSLIFNSPEQNAYFYAAQNLSHDLSTGIALWMAAICLILAVALPAPHDADSSNSRH